MSKGPVMLAPAITTRDVWKSYQLDDTRVDALRGVDVAIDSGEFVVLLGPSGSGKSSLLHLMGAMDRPTHGEVLLSGERISDLSPVRQAELRLCRIGFVFQTFNLMPTLTALENVSLPMRLAGVGRRERAERALELLDLVGMADRANHYPRQLSGGQRQRVAVARACANNPALILADEPTGNLDTDSGIAVMELLHRAQERGATVVVVTHNSELTGTVDRVLTMRDGQIQAAAAAG